MGITKEAETNAEGWSSALAGFLESIKEQIGQISVEHVAIMLAPILLAGAIYVLIEEL